MSGDSLDAVRSARLEARRCQRAVDGGSPPDFWTKRLTAAAKQYEAAAVILRMQIAALSPAASGEGEKP